MTIFKGIQQGQKSSVDITERLSQPWGRGRGGGTWAGDGRPSPWMRGEGTDLG